MASPKVAAVPSTGETGWKGVEWTTAIDQPRAPVASGSRPRPPIARAPPRQRRCARRAAGVFGRRSCPVASLSRFWAGVARRLAWPPSWPPSHDNAADGDAAAGLSGLCSDMRNGPPAALRRHGLCGTLCLGLRAVSPPGIRRLRRALQLSGRPLRNGLPNPEAAQRRPGARPQQGRSRRPRAQRSTCQPQAQRAATPVGGSPRRQSASGPRLGPRAPRKAR